MVMLATTGSNNLPKSNQNRAFSYWFHFNFPPFILAVMMSHFYALSVDYNREYGINAVGLSFVFHSPLRGAVTVCAPAILNYK